MLTLIFTCLMVWIFGKLIWIAFKMTWGYHKGFIQSYISSDHSDRAGDRRTGFCCPAGSDHNWNHYADMRNCGKIRITMTIKIV